MDKNTRIAIIGAGPAGLSAGMYLEQAGYENYTILERNDHVGGKCNSPHYNGRRYEMGAIMGVPSYYAVHDVEEFAGVTHDGPKLNRNYKDKDGKVIDPFNPKKNPMLIPRLLKMRNQVKKLGELLETKYKGYDVNGHRGVAQGRYEGDAVTPEREHIEGVNENLKDLAMPFKEFCEMNGVELTQDIWIGPFTSFGYGYFDEIPAAYVLKYLDFQTTMNFVNVNLWTWKDGTQSIWEALDRKLKHSARLNSEIEKVERKDDKVYITVNGKVEEYDKLIVTAPLQFFGDYADIREDEKSHFDKIDYERYDTMAVTTKPEDHPEISYYVFENMTPERYGHLMVYYRRWKDDINQPIVTYVLRNHKDKPEIPYEAAQKTVLNDLRTMHNPADKVINEGKWYYFPHIFSEDYAAGWYDDVEAMQGKYNTYYAGEIMSFGDMDETAEYSRELVERFFKD
ncbi:MAG: FAD-dependent oxidoreductase [Erysipelotrichaceae bacterium]|jgi:protoporphyrinogen oxidase|nr:FAD-dependent oxidoreductase [Erysipelotrichaceae bacterium]